MASQWGKNQEDVEETNEDGLLEGELAQLQLRYRVMQNSFHAYKEEAKRRIAKQKMLIKRLDLDNKEFETDLGKLETAQNRAKDEQNVRRLKELSHLEKDYHSLIEEEKSKMKEIDKKTAEVEKDIAEQRKMMGGTNNTATTYNSTQKCITVLENRLDKAITLFNKQLATNGSLRTEIDHLRRERVVFDNLYKKLAHELDKSKREMSDVIRDSTEAFEQRDDARNKMMALIERSEKDKEQHEIEIRDLQRMIDHDNRIREFMGIKASNRTELKAEEAAKKQKMDADKQTNADQVSIAEYEAALDQLKNITGEANINTIIETFERNEQENFALFNYVNELNNEVEVCTDQLSTLKNDINQFKHEDQEVDKAHQNMVLVLEKKVDQLRAETEAKYTNLKQVGKTLDELLDNIHGLFVKIGCDPRPILEMLGGDCGIRAKNVMMYLGQIEQRTIEMLTSLAYEKRKRAQLDGQIPESMETSSSNQILPVVPPSVRIEALDILDEEEQVEDRPFTREELSKYVMKHLNFLTYPTSLGSQTAMPVAAPKDKKKKAK